MSENTKRLMSFVVACAMVFTMMPMVTNAQDQEQAEIPETIMPMTTATESATTTTVPTTTTPTTSAPAVTVPPTAATESTTPTQPDEDVLELDVVKNVTIAEGEVYAYLSFTPTESGVYNFTSISGIDTYGDLYEVFSEETQWLASDDDGGDGNNFLISQQLTAGHTYQLWARSYSRAACSFQVIVERPPLVSLSFTPVSVIEGTNGHNSGSYWYYYEWDLLQKSTYTATFVDGTVLTGSGTSFTYNGAWYGFSYSSNQSSTNPWTVGNTYELTVSVMGQTASVPVTITKSPLVSLSFTAVSVIEGTNGYQSSGNWRYDEYDLLRKATYTAYLSNGTVLTGSGTSFTYGGEEYSFSYSSNQSDENPWTAGNTYAITVSVMRQTASVPVTITQSPLASLSFTPISVVEKTNGSDYGSYWHYSTWDLLQKSTYTAIFSDSTVLTGSGTSFTYNGAWYGFSYSSNQSGDNPWTVGNTYELTVYVLGETASVPVTITESPIESIEFQPIVLKEGEGGYNDWYNGYYYRYQWWNNLTYTVYLKDGSSFSGNGSSFYYNGDEYSIQWDDDQSGENPWVADNTYSVTVRAPGSTEDTTVYVTIASSTEDNGYEYQVQNGNAIIIGCTMQTEILQIPEMLGGYPVKGIVSLGEGISYAKEIRIPDSVTMLSNYAFKVSASSKQSVPLEKLKVGAGISAMNMSMLATASNLKQIEVAKDNPYLCSIEGVVYNKTCTAIVAYPPAKTDLHIIPETVGDISILFDNAELFRGINFQLGGTYEQYKLVDGVVYNPDMTKILFCTGQTSGSYVMPESVTEIEEYAFASSNFSSITVSPNVTTITYNAFASSIKLEEITIPSSVTFMDWKAFDGCENLNKVNITDVGAWCAISFRHAQSNPLYYAKNLYLNGELVENLVIPDGTETISASAFINGSMTSVTIPASLKKVGSSVFSGCVDLEKVYLEDLTAWCGIAFANVEASPLYNAKNLYIDGQLVEELVLPEVTAISKYAFYNASIKSVTVPATLQTIDYDAFFGCEDLEKVNIEDLRAWCGINFNNVKANPLYYAENVYLDGEYAQTLTIPAGTTEIRNYAFIHGSMTGVAIPYSVRSVGTQAFYESSLEQISFAEGITSIEEEAFANSALKSVELPDSLTSLGYAAFENCAALESATIGDGLTIIPNRAFAETGLKQITIPAQVTQIMGGAFYGAALTDVQFDCISVSIWGGAFSNCPLGDLKLGDNITQIDGAFDGIVATQIWIPATVTRISYRTFSNNENLVSVTIPSSVVSIDEGAFGNDPNLSHVLYTGTQEQWKTVECHSYEINNALIHFNATGNEVTTEQTCTTIRYFCTICDKWETVTKRNGAHDFVDGVCTVCGHVGCWDYIVDEEAGTVTITGYTGTDTDVVMPEEIDGMPVTGFTKETFSYKVRLTSVVIPETVTEICDGAFYMCSNLTEITIPRSITRIGINTFYGCWSLAAVYIEDLAAWCGIEFQVGYSNPLYYTHAALYLNGEIVTKLVIPEGVTSISQYAFEGCGSITEVVLPKSLTLLGDKAFQRCPNIEKVVFSEGMTSVSYSAFSGNTSLKEIVFSNTVTNISYCAFSGCSSLETITIPASVQGIGYAAFYECSSLEIIRFEGDAPYMDSAFTGTKAVAFYEAGTDGWDAYANDTSGNIQFYDCAVPVILKQPVNVAAEAGDSLTLSTEAYGQRLRYQWWYSASGSGTFAPAGGDTMELSITMTEALEGARAYCVITDVLGHQVTTDTVTIKQLANSIGIRISSKPYTLEYNLHQALRTRGLEVVLLYEDGSECPLQDYTVSGYDPEVSGVQTITVTYKDFTATFDVTVNGDKVTIVDTEEKIEVSIPNDSAAADTSVVVDRVDLEEEFYEIPEIIRDNESEVFDIELHRDGQKVQPDGDVRVSIPVPKHMHHKRCKVYHIGDDGWAHDMKARYHDGHMVFETNHFSYYAIVEVAGVTVSGTADGTNGSEGMTVKLLSDGEVLETTTVTGGKFWFENVASNAYTIEVSQEGMPTRKYEITVEDEDLTVDVFLSQLGDINADGKVDSDDVIQLLLYVTMPDEFPIRTVGDFTGDGKITSDDVTELLLHVSMADQFPLTTGG